MALSGLSHRAHPSRALENVPRAGPFQKIARVEYIHAGCQFEIGDIEINPFVIPHDAVDPIGFAFRSHGHKVAIATDLGYMPELVKQHLRGSDFLVLESNHDLDMLKVGPYPWYIKQRVMSRTGHLSNNVVSEFLSDTEVFDGWASHVVLAHLSEQNNTPDLAQITAEQALGSRSSTFAFAGSLHIASQHVPLGPFELYTTFHRQSALQFLHSKRLTLLT